MPTPLEKAMVAIKSGDKETGERLLRLILQTNPDNEMAWLWLSTIADSEQESIECLNRVLEINPHNSWAKRSLAALEKHEHIKPPPVTLPTSQQTEVFDTTSPPLSPSEATQTMDKVQLIQKEPAIEQPAPATDSPRKQEPTVRIDRDDLPDSAADDMPIDLPTAHTGTYDVFISYSRKDKPFVQKLYETLLAEGLEVWVDWGNIPLTADWRREIKEGIERANTIIFVISPDFLASTECKAELDIAEDFHKRLVPIVFRDVANDDVPQSLASLNWLFFRHSDDFDSSYQGLIESINTDLEWVKEHTRLLVRATEWEDQNKNNSFLLRGDDLREAEQLVAQAKDPAPTTLQKQYILASRNYATKRQRRNMAFVTAALIISIVLAIVAFFQFRVAQAERDEARRQTRIALSRKLGAEAIIVAKDQPDLAVLLSLQANNVIADDKDAGTPWQLLADVKYSPYLITILHGHKANVRTVDFSPDGTLLASGSKDKSIILWDVETHKPIGEPLTGHTDRVSQVAFSPDGKTLASGSSDSTIILWDVSNAEALATRRPIGQPLTGHTDKINSIDFSFDGKMLASGSSDDTIILWNVETGQPVGQPLTGHTDNINTVVFSPDGKTLVSAGVDNTIIFWNTETGQSLTEPLTGHTGWITSLAFSPDGQMLVSGSTDRSIRLWDPATGEQIREPFNGHSTGVTAVKFSPDGHLIASGSEDNSIILWDIEAHKQLGWPLVGHANSVLGIDFSPDGKILASASSDANIGLWDISAMQFLAGHNSVVRGVDYSPDGKTIASVSSDHTIRLWDAETHETIMPPLEGHTATVWGVGFSPNGQKLASGSADTSIILWNVENGEPSDNLAGHTGDVLSVEYNPNGNLLASGSTDNTIIIWNVDTKEAIHTLEGHEDSINDVSFSPDSTKLVSASNDGTIRLWDVETGQAMGQPITGHTANVNSVAFSPDGKLLASGGHDNNVILWNAETGKLINTLVGHVHRVRSIAFHPEGRILASGSYDTNILLWDVENGYPVGPPLLGHTNDVNSIAWSPDGNTLVSGGWDDMVILWDINFDSWYSRACQVANRNLTEAEWNHFVGSDYAYKKLCKE